MKFLSVFSTSESLWTLIFEFAVMAVPLTE